MAIGKITEAKKQAIERKSVKNLPDRPSRFDYSASTVKNAFIWPITGGTDSLLAEINRIVDELNAILQGEGSGTLETTAQTLIAAINELNAAQVDKADSADIGDVSGLTTTAKVVVDAINELNAGKADSATVTALLATKQNTLTFDNEPTASSTNPVTSGGIKAALDDGLDLKVDKTDVTSDTTANKIVRRDSSGDVIVPQSPGGDNSATSKKFVLDSINSQISRVFKPSGSISFATLLSTVTPGSSTLGNIYNITDSFTTTNAFVEGAGYSFPSGTNVGVIAVGAPGSETYYFDVYTGYIDLSGYYQKSETYSQTETNGLLAEKVNNSDFYDYQYDVDVILEDILGVHTTYNITATITNGDTEPGSATSIQKGGTAIVTIKGDTGYNAPDSVTVTNADYSYDKTTGVVTLNRATGNVTITADCVLSDNNAGWEWGNE